MRAGELVVKDASRPAAQVPRLSCVKSRGQQYRLSEHTHSATTTTSSRGSSGGGSSPATTGGGGRRSGGSYNGSGAGIGEGARVVGGLGARKAGWLHIAADDQRLLRAPAWATDGCWSMQRQYLNY